MSNKKGFTIIELIVVIVILGILVLIATPKFSEYVKKAEIARIVSDVKIAENIVAIHLIEFGNLPKTSPIVDNDDLNQNLEEGKVFNAKGIIYEIGEEFQDITDTLEIPSKLEGKFIANTDGKTYYVHNESLNTFERSVDNDDGDYEGNEGDRDSENDGGDGSNDGDGEHGNTILTDEVSAFYVKHWTHWGFDLGAHWTYEGDTIIYTVTNFMKKIH